MEIHDRDICMKKVLEKTKYLNKQEENVWRARDGHSLPRLSLMNACKEHVMPGGKEKKKKENGEKKMKEIEENN